MTRAATLPLSFAAHGAALAAVVALSVMPAELPTARAAAPPLPLLPIFPAAPRPLPSPPAVRRSHDRVATHPGPPAAPAERPAQPVTTVGFPLIDGPPVDAPLDEGPATCPGCPVGPGVQTGDVSAPDGEGDGGAPLRIGGHIREPRKLHHVVPVYPDVARAARVQGSVVIECTLTPEGRVAGVSVVSGHPLLSAAAVHAVQQWRFTPNLLNDVAVPVILTVTVNFRLSGSVS
jgi:protein TonB